MKASTVAAIASAEPFVTDPSASAQATRLHALDALRAVALLLGLVLHSLVPYVLPPGLWAVGTNTPVRVLGWLVYYIHSFRLEVFFLLAGFFGALIVDKRGLRAWLKDRAMRIVLVFLVALVPMKIALAAVWISGGRATGWLVLPEPVASLPLWQLAVGALFKERWPTISTTHLWFLYYLAIISMLWSGAFALVSRFGVLASIAANARRAMQHAVASRFAPVWLALITTPVLNRMVGMDIDTPDWTLAWHRPVLALYGFYFAIGWALHGAREILHTLAARWTSLLIGGIAVSFPAAILLGLRHQGGPWALANAEASSWLTSFGTSLVMALSVLGWIGAFVRFLDRPSPNLRYLSDASYWIYIVHLPVMTALQVWWAGSGLPWWVQVPLVNVTTLAMTIASYQLLVRSTWLGAWINGARR